MKVIETEQGVTVRLDAAEHFIDIPGFLHKSQELQEQSRNKGVSAQSMEYVDTCPDFVFYVSKDDFTELTELFGKCYGSRDFTKHKQLTVVAQDGASTLTIRPVYSLSGGLVPYAQKHDELQPPALAGWYKVIISNYSLYYYNA